MLIIYAIILGIVQGITEFLPVSSSGHLVVASNILGITDAFTFDVLLNFGSLAALIFYYRHRIMAIINKIIKNKDWALALKVVVATTPAVIVGLLLNSFIVYLNEMIWVVVATLTIVGVLMILYGKENKDADNRNIEQSVGWPTAIKIGLAQVLALVPGVSRSGITILTGLRNNLSAEKAAEFSFLLAIPITTGASIKTLLSDSGMDFIKNNFAAFAIGNIVCFIAGILAINFLIKLVSKRGLKDFGWYRIILASILSVLLLAGIL